MKPIMTIPYDLITIWEMTKLLLDDYEIWCDGDLKVIKVYKNDGPERPGIKG